MSIEWPHSLVPEIAERRCIIVLGAGASAGCKSQDGNGSPPDWANLLNQASALLADDSEKDLVASLVQQERYLDAAEIIVTSVNPADYSAFIRRIFVDPHYGHSTIHEEVYRPDAKIVVTTNYDEVYETYCKQGKGSLGYNVCRYYESHALNDVRSTMRVILKAHGCVSDPQRTVLSRTQYHSARRDHSAFFSLMDSLFLSNTLLFIGCSLVDPDFNLLLEGANIRCPSAHPHYALMEDGQPEALLQATKTVYNVKCLEFTAGQFDEITEGLKNLNDKVSEWRRTHP